MKKFLSAFALIMVLAISLSCFAACFSETPEEPTDKATDKPTDKVEEDNKVTVSWYQGSKLLKEEKIDITEIKATTYYVKNDNAKIYDTKGNVLGKLALNTAVTVTAYTEELAKITKDGKTGEVKITGFDYTPVFIADETATGGPLRVLRIKEALAAYEANCVGCVSKETYEAMKNALSRIEARIHPEPETPPST